MVLFGLGVEIEKWGWKGRRRGGESLRERTGWGRRYCSTGNPTSTYGKVKTLKESAAKLLNERKAAGGITPKKWTAKKNRLTAHKNTVQVSPYGISYFQNKSLCVPVRASDKTSISSSTR